MSTPKAKKPLTIDADLFNDLVAHFHNVHPAPNPDSEYAKMEGRLLMQLEYDKCVDGDGSGLCETHDYEAIEYYVGDKGEVLKHGTFNPEETGYPMCPQGQDYSDKKARQSRAA